MSWDVARGADEILACETERRDRPPLTDEWAGMFIALWPVRLLLAGNLHRLHLPGGWRFAALVAVPFLLFRLLDILKPWPCDRLQDLPGGQGIVADDVVAGLYSIPLTQALVPFLMAG